MSERDDGLAPCPNPYCESDTIVFCESRPNHWCECLGCDMGGPTATTSDEAARLWNALPRAALSVTPGRE